MPTTPISKGRPPLIPVSENVRNAPSLSPAEAHKEKAVGSRSTPEKRTHETLDSRSPGREATLNSRSNYETSFADDRGGKKSKILPTGKRVSFGGNSIRIIPQTNPDSFSKPLTEDRETSSVYTEIERIRTPPLSKRNPDMVSGINDDSDMDTLSATGLPSRISDSPSRLAFPKGSEKSPRSPNARRSSMFRASGRHSFGLFVDEDITMACRDIRIDPNDDDVTQTLPSGPSMYKEKIQEPEDGDITYTLGYGLRDLITEASHDEELTGNKNTSCPSPGENGIPKQFGVRNEFHPEEDLDPDTQESGRQATPRESQNNEYGVLMDYNKTSGQHPVPSTRQDHSSPLSNLLDESNVDNHMPRKQSTFQTGVNEKETNHSENRPLIAPNEEDQERVQRNDLDGNGNGDLETQLAENMHTSEEPTRDSGIIATPGANNDRNLDAFHGPDSPQLPKPIGEALEGPAHDAVAEYQGLLSSVMDSSDPKQTERVSPAHRATDFNLDQHLRVIDVRFDNPARSVGREASLAPMESLPPKFDSSSSELASYELMKERYFLERLRKEKKRLQGQISSVMKSVEAIEKEIEALRPPMVEMLANYDDHSTTRIAAAFRCAVKRLRKTSAFEARGEWVTSRRGWETEICNGMVQCCTELEKDTDRTQAKRAAILDLADQFNEAYELSDTRKDDEEEGMETLSVARMLFNREMSTVTDLREYVVTQELYKKDAQRKQAVLEPLESRLSRECSELECYVGKGSPALRKMILERHEQSSIIAGVTGISLSRISTNSIALTICGLVNLYFTLHEERVINTSCKPLRFLDKENTSVLKTFIEGAVTLSSFAAQLKTVKMAHDIPMALRRFSHWMMRTQCLLEEAQRYYELHMGSITNSSVTEVNGSPSLHVDVSGSFYSLHLRSQFNVVVSITIHTVLDCADIQEQVVLKAVTRTIGNSPDDNAIQEAVLNANRGKPFSLYDAFEAIWDLLR